MTPARRRRRRGETALLQNDLSCGGAFVAAVNLGDHATLDLNGHAITSDTTSNAAVRCTGRRCSVVGPGDISGPDVGIGLVIGRQTRVVNTTCGKSGIIGGLAGENWGVCTSD
jgi:hypothetical protein